MLSVSLFPYKNVLSHGCTRLEKRKSTEGEEGTVSTHTELQCIMSSLRG